MDLKGRYIGDFLSPDTLQQNKILRVIKNNLVKKCLEMLAVIAEKEDDYMEFYEQFGKCLKLGVREDSANRTKADELLRFFTSEPGDEQDCLKEYVFHLKEGQNDIFFFSGECCTAVSSSPFLEELRMKGLEVLYMVLCDDEYAETLQQNKILRVIKKNLVQKRFEMLAVTAEKKDDYMEFCEQFGKCLKLGVREGSAHRTKADELLRFYSSESGEEQVCLKEYAYRLKEGQNDIFFLTGECFTAVSSSSFIVNLWMKGLEVWYMVFLVDEYAETLQQNKIMRVIKRSSVKKRLEMLDVTAEKKGGYMKVYGQFGKCLKLGVREDSANCLKVDELPRFYTSESGDEQVCLKEYGYRLKEGLNDVFFFTGECFTALSSSPFLEFLRMKGLEVLYMVLLDDECAVQPLKESDGKRLKSATKEGLGFEDEDEREKLEQLKALYEPLTRLMKEVLRAQVDDGQGA